MLLSTQREYKLLLVPFLWEWTTVPDGWAHATLLSCILLLYPRHCLRCLSCSGQYLLQFGCSTVTDTLYLVFVETRLVT